MENHITLLALFLLSVKFFPQAITLSMFWLLWLGGRWLLGEYRRIIVPKLTTP